MKSQLFFIALLFCATNAIGGSVIYVNGSVTTEGDGSSWTNAVKTIPLSVAAGDIVKIAAGTYKPTATILVASGGTLIGGYNATDDTRNYYSNAVVIDASENGAKTALDNSGVVDGVTIENGGGTYNMVDPSTSTFMVTVAGGVALKSTSVLKNSIVRQCVAINNGGGIHAVNGSPIVNNCLIYDNVCKGLGNVSTGAGAIGVGANTSLTIINSTIASPWLASGNYESVVQGLNTATSVINIYNVIVVPPLGSLNSYNRGAFSIFNSTWYQRSTSGSAPNPTSSNNLAMVAIDGGAVVSNNVDLKMNSSYQLQDGSPCIGVGTLKMSDGVTSLPIEKYDLAYKERKSDVVDMGAFAYTTSVVTSIASTVSGDKISIYPTLVKDVIYVDSPRGILTLYSHTGMPLHSESVDKHGQIDISHIPSGTYILTVVIDDDFKTVRIVKSSNQ